MAQDITALRNRTWHSLSPQTAQAGGMNLDQLKQFIAYAYFPTEAQLQALARYFGCCHGG